MLSSELLTATKYNIGANNNNNNKGFIKLSWSEPVFTTNCTDLSENFTCKVNKNYAKKQNQKMSSSFLTRFFKPSSTLLNSSASNNALDPDQLTVSQGQSSQNPKDPTQMYELLYNIDMVSGESVFMSELYLADAQSKQV